MSNELVVFDETGLTYTAKVLASDASTQVGSTVGLSPNGETPPAYVGDMPPEAVANTIYYVQFIESSVTRLAYFSRWDGSKLVAVGDWPTATQIKAEVDLALSDIHLDHLFASNYDPASKPGAATALLNELIEDDGGVSRYTANALENSPDTSAGIIADTVWAELLAAHSGVSGSAAEALTNANSLTVTAESIANAIISQVSTINLVSFLDGDGNLQIPIGSTVEFPINGSFPDDTTYAVLTIKRRLIDADSEAIMQIESAGGPGPAGLKVLNGAATTAAWASITLDQPNNMMNVKISDNATDQLEKATRLFLSVKRYNASDSYPHHDSQCSVVRIATRQH
ncbi:MAG: hypothetical protein AAF702_44565 [Chloroflexota bacterium]